MDGGKTRFSNAGYLKTLEQPFIQLGNNTNPGKNGTLSYGGPRVATAGATGVGTVVFDPPKRRPANN